MHTYTPNPHTYTILLAGLLLLLHIYITMKQIAVLLLFVGINTNLRAQKILKATLVFKGIQNKEGSWQLCFVDKKNTAYCFNTQRSNTIPYVFYSTATEGSYKENEKIKGAWFLVSYTILRTNKIFEKIITHVEAITFPK